MKESSIMFIVLAGVNIFAAAHSENFTALMGWISALLMHVGWVYTE